MGFNNVNSKEKFSSNSVEKPKQSKIVAESINDKQLNKLYEKTEERILNNRKKVKIFIVSLGEWVSALCPCFNEKKAENARGCFEFEWEIQTELW